MKIKEIQFKEDASKRIYLSYMKRIERMIKPLSKTDQTEVLLEFNSHIFEGLAHKHQKNEIVKLVDILDKLGNPEEVLKPLIADKKLEEATRTFNPIHLFKALILNITNGVSYLFFAILYLSLLGFIFVIYAKIKNPDQVGLFMENNSFLALGRVNESYLQNPNISEVLRNWFIPVMLLSIILSYLLITLLLKFKRSINKK
jgi:hypothetical protein